jgi:4-hydroxybenzoate polyprenyltransferase
MSVAICVEVATMSEELAVPAGPGQQRSGRASWLDYVSIARPDHWVKHVFIIPGLALAFLLGAEPSFQPLMIVAGFVSAALISSANYVVNEWLDADFDAHHPMKSQRPAVAKVLSRNVVIVEYSVLAVVGLWVAYLASMPMFVIAVLFLVSGWTYNIPPLRSKDKAYLDVASEAINNPIRLAYGWAMVDMGTIPPSSLLLAYWAGGAFLMSTKRLAEYRTVSASHGVDVLHLYRSSFRQYTESRLLLQSFTYAQLACFFIAVFLVKYRIEYIVSFPLFALLFTVYLRLGLKQGSAAQTPERLFRESGLLVVVAVLVSALVVLTIVDIPALQFLSDPQLIRVK